MPLLPKRLATPPPSREKLKTSEDYLPKGGHPRNPEISAKIGETHLSVFQAARQARALEREQWAKRAESLSSYELARRDKLAPSPFAYGLRREAKWLPPDEGEFLGAVHIGGRKAKSL